MMKPIKNIFSKLLFILPAFLLISCQNSNQPESKANDFWSHKFYVINNVSYVENGNNLQKLDLYLQGEYVGEPKYVETDSIPRKILIYIHGGGWAVGDKMTSMNYFLHFLEKGWHVVSINYTLAKDGENASGIPTAVNDVKMALEWICQHAEQYHIDLNNVALGGESAGGQLSLIAGLYNTNPQTIDNSGYREMNIRAIINWFGVIDIENFFYHIMTDQQKNNFTEEAKEELSVISKEFSPINFVSEKAPSIITIHGNEDSVVPVEQAYALHKALDSVHVKNELLVFKGGKHVGFTDMQWEEAFSTIFEFVSN
ncbi:MAG: alpha/beta hydrolase [Bacteroidota bacterium]